MRTLSTLILALFVSASVFAETKGNAAPTAVATTTTLKGQVIDRSTGETLTGVSVKLEGTDKVCYTDLDGTFVIPDVRTSGNVVLSTSFISYKEQKVAVDLTKNNTVSLYVEYID